jgi:hypothetical protein
LLTSVPERPCDEVALDAQPEPEEAERLEDQKPYFVKTSFKFGLTEELADQAIAILNAP